MEKLVEQLRQEPAPARALSKKRRLKDQAAVSEQFQVTDENAGPGMKTAPSQAASKATGRCFSQLTILQKLEALDFKSSVVTADKVSTTVEHFREQGIKVHHSQMSRWARSAIQQHWRQIRAAGTSNHTSQQVRLKFVSSRRYHYSRPQWTAIAQCKQLLQKHF